MKHLLTLSFLFIGFLAFPAQAQVPASQATTNTIAGINRHVEFERARLLMGYLKNNPNAPDSFQAINEALTALQKIRDENSMDYFLERRYDLLMRQPQLSYDAVISKTAMPLLNIRYKYERRAMAKEFADRIRQDFGASPAKDRVYTELAQLEARFKQPAVGEQIPHFAFTDSISGNTIDIKNYRGKYVLLNFWVSFCDECKKQKLIVQNGWDAYNPQGFEVFGFSQDKDPAAMKKIIDEFSITWPQCLDSAPAHRFAAKWNLNGIPTNILVGPDGKIEAMNLRDEALLEKLDSIYKPQ